MKLQNGYGGVGKGKEDVMSVDKRGGGTKDEMRVDKRGEGRKERIENQSGVYRISSMRKKFNIRKKTKEKGTSDRRRMN